MLQSLLRLGSHDLDLNASAFKNSSRLVTAATALALFSGASLLATVSARADETNKYTAVCASIKDAAKRAGCMIGQIERHTQDTKQHSEKMKRVEQDAKAITPCYDFLIGKVNDKLTTKEEVMKKAGGNLTDANVCAVAESYGRRADLKPPVSTVGVKPSTIAYTR